MGPSAVVFIFGALIGSFLNVCIFRMPREQSIVTPRSYCPHCKKTVRWYDNIPLISYILLGARCRSCKKFISFEYFIVEFLTAGLLVALFQKFGATFEFFTISLLCLGLIIASFIDIHFRIIPDEVSVGGVVLGFLLSIVSFFLGHGNGTISLQSFFTFRNPVIDSFLGILAGGGIIYLTGVVFDVIYFKLLKHPPIQGETESMGGGDVKLLAMIGAFLGWKAALMTFFIAPLFGVVIGLCNLLIKKDHTMPYGPFLSLAAVLTLFFYTTILKYMFILQ